MAEDLLLIREFLNQLDTTLTRRKLYAANTAPYREAAENLFEKLKEAFGEGGEGFTLRATSTDLFLGKASVLQRSKREESFFFPLYRDGLREITFLPSSTVEEVTHLLETLEAERKKTIGPSQDTISFLWRGDLQGITFKAIDGIGEEEGDDQGNSVNDDYQAMVADVLSKIQNPAAPETGQGYSFRIDADIKVAATDMHYEGTTAKQEFENNPTVLQLSEDEVAALRSGVNENTEELLLARFIEILFMMLMDPTGTVSGPALIPVFKQMIEGIWISQDYHTVSTLLNRLRTASESAPLPETRESVQKIWSEFLTPERIHESFDLVLSGTLPVQEATSLWDSAGDEPWGGLMNFCSSLPNGDVRNKVNGYLRKRIATNRDLLRKSLASKIIEEIRAGLALIDTEFEGYYEQELLALVTHPEESIRLKGVAAAGRIGGQTALQVLWDAMEKDTAKGVRLLAFRQMANAEFPELAKRLKNLVIAPEFSSRPLWEREKYVRLLGRSAGLDVQDLFESWIPTKRWFWQNKDQERAALALQGLTACGDAGRTRVRAIATEGGKLSTIAQKALASAGRSTTEMIKGQKNGVATGQGDRATDKPESKDE